MALFAAILNCTWRECLQGLCYKTVMFLFLSVFPFCPPFFAISASKARRPDQFSGKITVKAKEKSYSKLEIPFQAEVLEGSAIFFCLFIIITSISVVLVPWEKTFPLSINRYLGFDHTATLFHIRDSPVDPVDRPIYLTNTFNFAIRIHNVSLPDDAKMFNVSHSAHANDAACWCFIVSWVLVKLW